MSTPAFVIAVIIGIIAIAAFLAAMTKDDDDGCQARRGMRMRNGAAIFVAVLAAVFVYGEIHIVHGPEIGWHICRKYGWTLDDTFVNVSAYDSLRDLPIPSQETIEKCLR